MHTIDLLKGEGLPAKTTLGSVFFVALMFVVPLLAGAGFVGFYAINKTEMDITQGRIDGLKKSIEASKPQVSQSEGLVRQRSLYAARLTEVSKCVDTYLQWTPVLIEVARDMPANMIMNSLSVTGESGRPGMRRNSDPNKPLTIPIPERTMTLELSGESGADTFNTRVQEYQKKLKAAEPLGPELRDLTYQMQAASADNREDSFTMSFVFQKQKK